MTGIPLAFLQGFLDKKAISPADLETIIKEEENNWSEIGNLQGTYFEDPACLVPVEDDAN